MIWAFDGKIGGVGKSIGAATCIERLAKLGEFSVIEADVNNNVGAYADGIAKKVWRVNLLASSGWLDLASAIADEPCSEIVLSLPAGSDTVGHAEILRDVLTETNRQMALMWMMNTMPESVALLSKALMAFDDLPVQVVPVRNLFFGEQFDFSIWNESKARARFLESGGVDIDFPELIKAVTHATFGASPKVRFSAVTGLSYGHRWALARWLDKTAALYAGIVEKISPVASCAG